MAHDLQGRLDLDGLIDRRGEVFTTLNDVSDTVIKRAPGRTLGSHGHLGLAVASPH
jgi:hypothetical protein